MNLIETQLAQVLEKVDALQRKIEVLDGRVEALLTQDEPLTQSGANYKALNNDLNHHKDVLSDEKRRPGDRPEAGAGLSSDIQIQRLTAQLTAAYGRIAALEEQLLARREPQH